MKKIVPKKIPQQKVQEQSVSPDDLALFHTAIGAVPRLHHTQTEARVTPPPPRAHMRRRDEIEVRNALLKPMDAELEVDLGEPLYYVKDGHSKQLLKKLGKGEFSVRDVLDLHQMTSAVASQAITLFLADCLRARQTCVKIIHGKGLRSKAAGPILKKLTDRLLRQRNDVIAFRSARPNDGGTGALIVLLKKL